MKYKKKIMIIDAIQYNGSNLKECLEFIGTDGNDSNVCSIKNGKLFIFTPNGEKQVNENDYIVKEGNYLFVLKENTFNKIYERYSPYEITYVGKKGIKNTIVVDEIIYKDKNYLIVRKDEKIINISDKNAKINQLNNEVI